MATNVAPPHLARRTATSKITTFASDIFRTVPLIHDIPLALSRLKSFPRRLTLSEVSGSFGDFGTFIPLTIALSRSGAISLPPAIFFAGLSNILAGLAWDLPMPVQPMKSIAAAAVVEQLSRSSVTASGILVGSMLILLSITNLIEVINMIVPVTVVSGLQLGLGIKLSSLGISMVTDLPFASQIDCGLLGVLSAILGVVLLKNEASTLENKIKLLPPAAVTLFLIALTLASIELKINGDDPLYDLPLKMFGPSVVYWAVDGINPSDWREGFFNLALPQLPLTTLNSVVSVAALASTLYPERRKPPHPQTRRSSRHKISTDDDVLSRREVAMSVGLLNSIFCLFGGMPNCHGAGGLAGQHRFGARNGTSVIFLGILKITIAIFFGASALTFFEAIPSSILGVLLAIAGAELGLTGLLLTFKDIHVSSPDSKTKLFVLMCTTVVIVGTGKTQYGVLAGLVAYVFYGDGFEEYKKLLQWARQPTPAATSEEMEDVTTHIEVDEEDDKNDEV
ncbi:hypothetical protein TrVE_jg1309 [Triparma verrucosa]|uniref:Sulfate transporter n=1 Tax=Triparma verrucosa TaxID=1606542 RepID=A0A9W7BMX7_9STRA|nr:hypothetical protein TrVE_jg1309 [Triparma verrucosa]